MALVMMAVIGLGSLLGTAAPVASEGVAMHEQSPPTTYQADLFEDLIDLIERLLMDP